MQGTPELEGCWWLVGCVFRKNRALRAPSWSLQARFRACWATHSPVSRPHLPAHARALPPPSRRGAIRT